MTSNHLAFGNYATLGLVMLAATVAPAKEESGKAAVVANCKVVSDKVKDVSSLGAWRKSYIKDRMSDKEKAVAIWECMVGHQHQDSPPREYVNHENLVQDAIKMMNVYGYSFCGVAANEMAGLARYVGVEARISSLNGHVVPEFRWNDSWHMLDASLINYFPKADGELAGIDEISKAVQDWLAEHPGLKGDEAGLREFQERDNCTGWKEGPALLASSPLYDAQGWLPARTHGWYSTMCQYDGGGDLPTPQPYEAGYSMGYKVNVQLRPGERLVRNWFNKGMHIGMDGSSEEPGCMKMRVGEDNLVYAVKFGDKAVGRVGNGRLEYVVPLADESVELTAPRYENLQVDTKGKPVLGVKDASKQGILEIRMPSSYVYLKGELLADAQVSDGGSVGVYLSDNNGLDWKDVGKIERSGPAALDISRMILRKYDYIVRLVLNGESGLNSLAINNDIQHSQRPLPALEAGENTITFTAGPQTGTVTIEGSCFPKSNKGLNLTYKDFHPEIKNIGDADGNLIATADPAEMTYTISTPGDMTALSIMTHYRARSSEGGWDVQVSYDDGKTFNSVVKCPGPAVFFGEFVEIKNVPAKTRSAKVRYVGARGGNRLMFFNQRIDADYNLPAGGMRPVKVTYVWEEGGIEKKRGHVARKAEETWKIKCRSKPVMKSIIMELAE